MAKKPGQTKSSAPITSYEHKDTRINIPTRELRDFVADEEKHPKPMLYPRDPSLDPQLVWKGKDEQDSKDLEVPVAPIYIQEKIYPQALIENLRAEAKKEAEPQADLFANFNGIPFEKQIEFYQREQHWSNRMILGDSLLVMTSLAEKEGLKGKVQMIYIDPPYGIKFGSNWQVSTRKREVKDGRIEDASREPEVVKAYRDTWELGIHSYLAYLRDRLTVARELLTESGSIFVQIGDENVHLVRCLMDEVFGGENFCAQIIYVTTSTQGSELLPTVNDYILWYAKSKGWVKQRSLYEVKELGGVGSSGYNFIEHVDGTVTRITSEYKGNVPEGARVFAASDPTSSHYSISKPVIVNGKVYESGHRFWSTSTEGMNRLVTAGRLLPVGQSVRFKRYFEDFAAFPRSNVWTDTGVAGFTSDRKIYVVQTNSKVIERCLLMTTDPGDLVLDPTCGSGTTAYVSEQWGRRWITIDTSRVALALARTRLMSAKFPYYLLVDSSEGLKKEAEITGKASPDYGTAGDIRKGFVYKRVPHVTLKSIANNPDIDGIHDKWQHKLVPLLEELNRLTGQHWQDWEVPREPPPSLQPSPTREEGEKLLEEWWRLRGEQQQEIDAAIARHADFETLFDQPFEDHKRLRVSGMFTVESLSPHRVLSTDESSETVSTSMKTESQDAGRFITMMVEYLRKAGVQNTKKNERLKFDRLEPFAGAWIQAEGEYANANGKIRRVAVCFGPEHGTVGTDLVKEAAKEAVQGIGFDLLLICGFAFDPHVPEEAKRYGKLTVLPTRMNPDLTMGDELLKKTGAGNLFMVFGEPDVEIRRQDSKFVAEIKGVDVYDPTTGQIRSSSTDDIACWFIDTNYNGESFFVRHAYFTGADRPFEKLKKALRTEVNEEAWSTLYSTVSRPFTLSETGKIAIKVINHYGDEVLKVFSVS